MQKSTVSIIIPTHDRVNMVIKSLKALEQQDFHLNEMEVLVVADACRDNTVKTVNEFAKQSPLKISVLQHKAKSAAATRNLGAANANGRILLFLDDDIIAAPHLVSAHINANKNIQVVLGYSKPRIPDDPTLWQQDARCWWEDVYTDMRKKGHRYSYRDFFSGNVSMAAKLYQKMGGYDESFSGRLEDYELGLRLVKEGIQFKHIPEALGLHYDCTDLPKWLDRIRQEGIADVQIGEQHPELRTALFGTEIDISPKRSMYCWLAFNFRSIAAWLEYLKIKQAFLYEKFRLRSRCRKAVQSLRELNYWHGVASEVGGEKALIAWLQEAQLPSHVGPSALVIDLSEEITDEEYDEYLRTAQTMGLRLAYRGFEFHNINPDLGAESLSREHITRIFRETLKNQFIPTLALKFVLDDNEGKLPWLSK